MLGKLRKCLNCPMMKLLLREAFPNNIQYPTRQTDLVEGRNNMLRRKTHESCIKYFYDGKERGEVELS
ncbi:CLUMA_CG016726, isoform A [Clunio marinus]|uniref:CLUMA_CG016726, isoform A n=1 Tax=Clunio marinus TaxID=568069 RepID=A0A1J1ITX9_9DIPT|nr:CLUMA_CG016726, isoform A [Clunio marinus]